MSTVAARIPAAGRRAHAVYTRTEVLGLALLASAPLLLIVAAGFTGIPLDDALFLLFPISVLSIGAALTWRFGTWSNVLGIVLAVAGAFMLFWIPFGMVEPASFVEFTTGVAFVVGFLLAIGGGVASVVKRADIRTEATRTEHIVDRTALALVVLALLVSLPMYLAGRETVSAAAAAGAERVEIANFEFPDVVVSQGTTNLVVANTDPFWHTFTVQGTSIDVKLLPASSVLVPIGELPPGTYTFYCDPHSSLADGLDRDSDMMGIMTIP